MVWTRKGASRGAVSAGEELTHDHHRPRTVPGVNYLQYAPL
jgi:hypothetical protein